MSPCHPTQLNVPHGGITNTNHTLSWDLQSGGGGGIGRADTLHEPTIVQIMAACEPCEPGAAILVEDTCMGSRKQ